MLVFDSSALFAYLQNEDGAAFVENLLDDADVEKVAHAVNLCEVFYGLSQKSGEAAALQSLEDLRTVGIVAREDMDATFWQDAGRVLAAQRSNGYGLALGDAYCVALARRLGADIVTCDHVEFEPIAALKWASVTFIR